jgi:hypothetical protein
VRDGASGAGRRDPDDRPQRRAGGVEPADEVDVTVERRDRRVHQRLRQRSPPNA